MSIAVMTGLLLFASWIIAIAVWRFARIEQRWSLDLAPVGQPAESE